MLEALFFWAVSILIGILAVPLTMRMFRRFVDAGIGFSLPLGLIVLSTIWFLLRVIGLPNGMGSITFLCICFAALSVFIAWTDRHFSRTLRRVTPFGVCILVVFTIAFFAYLSFRIYTPEIVHTEQPMDLMMLNAVIESPNYPPHDPWFSGESLSYYYGGFVQVGLLILITDISTSVGYNLGLALVFAGSATAIFSLVTTLFRWFSRKASSLPIFAASSLGIVLLLFSGSLTGSFELAALYFDLSDSFLKTLGLVSLVEVVSTSWYPTEFWFWWRATRLIPETIIEFPAFSFLLGDLHPHLMSIPGIILSLGIAAGIWRSRGSLSFRSHLHNPIFGILLAFVMGSLVFVNAWDIVTFNIVIVVAGIARNLRTDFSYRSLIRICSWFIPVLCLAFAMYGPWYATFSTQAAGIAPYMGSGSSLEKLILLNGPMLLTMFPLVIFALRDAKKISWRISLISCAFPVLPCLIWLIAVSGSITELERSASGWATVIFEGFLLWSYSYALIVFFKNKRFVAVMLAAIAILATLLCYGSEFFYIRDVFEDVHPRSNTVFKLMYQSWILSAVVGAISLVEAFRRLQVYKLAQLIFSIFVISLIASSLVYISIAIPNRVNENKSDLTLNGLAYVGSSDNAVVHWLQSNVNKKAIVVEGSGRTWYRNSDGDPEISSHRIDYTSAGRIAARTGLQSPIGWPGHEIQWRPSKNLRNEIGRRLDLVDGVYTASEPTIALAILRELDADYIVVSNLEKTRYPGDLLPNFEEVLTLVFDSNVGLGSHIYMVPAH